MAISPAGCCHYRVVLTRDGAGVLAGRAEPNREQGRHPGICGNRPHILLIDGAVILRSTWSERVTHAVRSYGPVNWGPPASEVRLQIGDAFHTIAREGDELQVARGGTAEIALALFRGDDLQLAAGALRELDLRGAAVVEEDPRVKDQEVYGVVSWLARPGTELVWVNADDGAERAVATVAAASGPSLVIAIAGRDPVRRRELNHRLALPLAGGVRSRWFIDVDERFTRREQWLEYVRSLPRTPPPDLWVKARVGATMSTLREGEYAFEPPWHVYLVRVARRGLPGRQSQLALARADQALTRDIVVHSANVIAGGGAMLLRR